MSAPFSPAPFPVVLPGACRRWRCEPGWNWTRSDVEVPPEQELWLVWAGRGRLRTADGERTLRPGFGVWMRPGGEYAAKQEAGRESLGLTSLRFRFQNRALDRAAGAGAEAYPEFYDVWDFSYLDAVTRRIVELVGQAEEEACAELRGTAGLLLGGVLSDLAARFAEGGAAGAAVASPAERQRREAVQRAVRLIEESFAEDFARPLSVAGLAREVGYSPAHFSSLFRRIAGETAEAMIVRLRIERARHLLRHTGLTVGEIADRTGYRDVYFFSRQFKCKTSLTPTEYRFFPRGAARAAHAAAAAVS